MQNRAGRVKFSVGQSNVPFSFPGPKYHAGAVQNVLVEAIRFSAPQRPADYREMIVVPSSIWSLGCKMT